MRTLAQDFDVLIVGAGPAGLAAAVYLARYRRRVLVVHDGLSRASRIPRTFNVPGFPEGIAGAELLARMRRQAELYGARVEQDHISLASRAVGGFVLRGDASRYQARALILATGVVLNEIDVGGSGHEDALRLACLRYCPICDGFEAVGRSVAVVGGDAHGAAEALFLRGFTDRVTLLTLEACELSGSQREQLATAGVQVIDAPCLSFNPGVAGMDVRLCDGRTMRFDVVYPALGVRPRAELAEQLGVSLSDSGCILPDPGEPRRQPGVYAAGDVVEALDQITVAIGHGATAATQAHNWLRSLDGVVLETRRGG